MSEKIYNWKRFWCPWTSQANLGDRGYLDDPESVYGHWLNPELLGLEAIADVPCLILLGEPGIGKSQEMENLLKYTGETIKPPHRTLKRDLRSCDNLATYLIQHQDFIDWMNGEHRLYLFLDSLDQGVANLATQLVDEFSQDKYSDKLDRLYIRIACRMAVFPRILEEGIAKLWEETSAIYKLAPLRNVDVENAAIEEGLNSQDFLSEVWDKALVPLAVKPLTLGFLFNTYKRNGGQFPSDQTLCNFYLDGCRFLCEEDNSSRKDAKQIGLLEPDQRLIIAARIAAITVFANRLAIWRGRQGEALAEDVLIKQLILGNEFSNGRLIDVTELAIQEVLGTGLFSSRESNRIDWAHQTYAEFLAAWYLIQHSISTSQILNLLIYPDGRVVPQLQETTAWLASMRPEIFQEVVRTDPDILLQSDIATTDYKSKAKLVESLLKLHDSNKLELFKFRRYDKLHYPDLAKYLEAYIRDSSKNQQARKVAINIAIDCQEKDVQDCLVDVACDTTQPYKIRERAAYAVSRIGDEDIKSRLKPLALDKNEENPDDNLRGYSLQAIWPQYISVNDLLNSLSPPTTTGIIGSVYQNFIAIEFIKHLELPDLPIALQWLENLPHCRIHLHYPFRDLADSVMLKGWQNLDEPGVIEAFANIAMIKLRQGEGILGDKPSLGWTTIGDNDQNYDDGIEALIRNSDKKRRKLIKAIISLIPRQKNDFYWLKTIIICSKDILWIIERVTSSKSDDIANTWAEILDESLDHHQLEWKNTRVIDAILRACSTSLAMKNKFKYYITSIELDSEIADNARAGYLKRQNDLKQPEPLLLVTTELKQKVLSILEEVESKHPEMWWKLCMEMTLTSMNNHYHNHYTFEPDITTFPGWIEADINTQSRIIKAAKTYLIAGEVNTQEWIVKNSLSNPPFAGYQVFYLLLQQDPEFIITAEIWEKWLPVILKSVVLNNSSRNKVCQEMVKKAYEIIPNKFIETLIILITQDRNQSDSFIKSHIYERIRDMLGKYIASLIFDKIDDANLNAKLMESLLLDIFDHTIEGATFIALSFLTRVKEVREKRIIAARMLTIYADDSSWSTLWPIIQQDCTFGCEVFESIALEPGYQITMEQNLNEDHLANLYIFLVQQFPESEEVKSQDNQGATVKRMESIDGIKIWRSNILQRLQSIGSVKASEALRKMIVELPEQKGDLQQKLLAIESSIRRTTWKQPTPEEILQLIVNKEPSNLELDGKLNSINRDIQQMADEPKIDNSIYIVNPVNSEFNGGVGNINIGGIPSPGKESDRIAWLTLTIGAIGVLVALVAIAVNGVFTEDIKKFLTDQKTPPKVEKKIEMQKSNDAR
jgi:predicted NACHT family NTPase